MKIRSNRRFEVLVLQKKPLVRVETIFTQWIYSKNIPQQNIMSEIEKFHERKQNPKNKHSRI